MSSRGRQTLFLTQEATGMYNCASKLQVNLNGPRAYKALAVSVVTHWVRAGVARDWEESNSQGPSKQRKRQQVLNKPNNGPPPPLLLLSLLSFLKIPNLIGNCHIPCPWVLPKPTNPSHFSIPQAWPPTSLVKHTCPVAHFLCFQNWHILSR